MLELIQQNPLVSLILILVPVIAGTWKVFDVLFVKPRDFRIAILEKNVDELRKEFQRLPTAPSNVLPEATETPRAVASVPTAASEAAQAEKIEKLVEGTTLLNDLSAFYASWRDKSLTELQRDQFEKNYVGQRVVWRARLGNVTEEKDGLLWVSLTSEKERDYGVHVIAIFDSRHKEALLVLKKEEIVTVSGVIDRFFLSPMIKDCNVVRNA
jgi:hypothetical protein